MKRTALLATVLTMLYYTHGLAYELRTHAYVTTEGIKRSKLFTDGSLASELGLQLNEANTLGTMYFEGTNVGRYTRLQRRFESARAGEGIIDGSVASWFITGAIREDDLTTVLGCGGANVFTLLQHTRRADECNPQEDHPPIDRVFNHFLDPQHNNSAATSTPGAKSAVNWAIGTDHAFDDASVTPSTSRGNKFSLVDARNAMYYALSGKDPDSNAMNAGSEELRKAWWATALRSLGDASHLLQDMAQPQHTRNEPHPGGFYELYIEGRTSSAEGYRIDGTKFPLTPVPLTEGPSVSRTRYSDFWSAGDGLGLANFSSRTFMTDKTNIGTVGILNYPLPSHDRNDYVAESVPATDLTIPGFNRVFLTSKLLDAKVPPYGPTARAARITTESSVADYLQCASTGGTPLPCYSMNRFNYDDQAAILLPKAAAYTAGLIDYFFRARIDMVSVPGEPDTYRVKNLGNEDIKGTFELYYDDTSEERKRKPVLRPDGTPLILQANSPISAGGYVDFEVIFNVPLDAKIPGQYMLVFRGEMGEEKPSPAGGINIGSEYVGAVAGRVIDARRPTALYVAGLDNQNNWVSMKIDEHGLRILSGPGGPPGGTSPTIPKPPYGDLDPLYEVLKKTDRIQPLGRVARTPQVIYSKGFYPGYETAGISFYRGSERALTYLRDALGIGQMRFSGDSDAAWRAKTDDGTIYTFDVDLQSIQPFMRWGSSKNGALTGNGSITLPPLPVGAQKSYSAFRTGELVISPDGLSVKGFWSRPTESTMSNDELKVTLGSSPSLSWVSIPTPGNVANASSTGPCTPSLTQFCTVSKTGQFTTELPRSWIGYVDEEPRYWSRQEYSEYTDDSRFGGGGRSYTEGDGCPYKQVFESNSVNEKTTHSYARYTSRLSDGTQVISEDKYNPDPAHVRHNLIGTRTDTYSGAPPDDHLNCTVPTYGAPIMPDDYDDNPQKKLIGTEVVQSFSGAENETLFIDRSANSATYRLGSLPVDSLDFGPNALIGDVSAIGEAFIANPNKAPTELGAIVLYRRAPNSQLPPVLTFPGHVVKLIAAFWM
ncbi:hypothetical protein BWI17_14585 [Betaproteobacteria bacterium GR16-43]|nr:hypothetical protein BWI17_14585 [Betaproteobacteria bacterium GR16-43]